MKRTIIALCLGSLFGVPGLVQAQSLEQAVAQSLATYPKVKEAFDLYQVRRYQNDGARSGYLPTVDAYGGIGYSEVDNSTTRAGGPDVDPTQNRQELGISLRQMLFDGFDTSNNVDRTAAEAEAQRWSLIAEAENTALRTSEVYLNVLRQKEILELSQRNLETHLQIQADINKRTSAGIGSTADQTQVDGRVARAYANLEAAQNNYNDVMSQFMRIVNEPAKDLVQPVPDATKIPPSIDDALKIATKQHPTLLSAEQDIEAAKYQHEGAKSGFYPKVNIEVDQRWNEDIGGINGSDDELTAMVRARYNLFNGGADLAKSRATSALYAQSKDIHENAYREVEEGTRLAWNAKESLEKQKVFLQKHVDSSYDTVQAYRKQFGLGQRTLLDLLNTENELFEARRSYIVAEYDTLLADYRIMNATGGLLDSLRVEKPKEWKESK